jgi:WD40 repeat protein
VGAIDDSGRALAWELSSPQPIQLTDKDAYSLTFSPSGDRVSVATNVETQLWDLLAKRKLDVRLPGAQYGGSYFSSDGRYLATAYETGDSQGVDVWRLPKFELVGSVPDAEDVVFLPQTEDVLAAGAGGVRVVSFDPNRSVQTVCRLTGNGRLSTSEWDQYAPAFKYVAACG